MTEQILQESPADRYLPPVSPSSAGGVSNRPAEGTLLARTSSGRHELRALVNRCIVPDCVTPASVVLGVAGFRDQRDERCVGAFCRAHGERRLAVLDRWFGGGK